MKSKMTIFILTLFLSVWSISSNAQTAIPKGNAQLIEFTNANAKFTVPDGKAWVIYNVFSDYIIVENEENQDIRVFIKSLNGVVKTDIAKNKYGAQLYRSTNSSLTIGMPLVFPEKTEFELILISGKRVKNLKNFNGNGYISLIEVDN